MEIHQNKIIQGKHLKPIVTDVFYDNNQKPKPIIIFCHGYKGFKDWGAWNLVAKAFVNAGFFFIKFNFSHNGGTPKQPIDFPDLEAFGNNNYTKELDDLETILHWITTHKTYSKEINNKEISLIGHSRGGGIVLIKAAENNSIQKVITWAGVSNYGNRSIMTTNLEQWKKTGVQYVTNSRTQQLMPHYIQFYEDFIQNKERLSIQRAVENLKIPHLIIHGNKDTSILLKEAIIQHKWNPKSELKIIENANHVFNTSHPWKRKELSPELKKVVKNSITFLKKENTPN